MGNCCACQAASRHGAETAEPWGGGGGGSEPASWAETGEERTGGVKATTVAVRISKRRLQELMAEAAGGMTVEEVLAEIVSAGEVVVGAGGLRRRRWEPALYSIPEAAVES